jgi:hypothetical protein
MPCTIGDCPSQPSSSFGPFASDVAQQSTHQQRALQEFPRWQCWKRVAALVVGLEEVRNNSEAEDAKAVKTGHKAVGNRPGGVVDVAKEP